MRPPKRKAHVYAVCAGQIPCFTEPDFPSVGTQVPGGTVEERESPAQAARREFEEETGLDASGRLRPLHPCIASATARVGRASESWRHPLMLTVESARPRQWNFHEHHATDVPVPILLRLEWLPLRTAFLRLRASGRNLEEPLRSIVRH